MHQCDHARRVSQVHRKRRRGSERRFQQIIVEPSEKGGNPQEVRDRYEAHHRVRITDKALRTAVGLSGAVRLGPCATG
ncbi:MAG: hypothetical protein R3E58_05220 [Phycisphaerae bacterium]